MGMTDAGNRVLPEENNDSEVEARCIVPKVNKGKIIKIVVAL
ncbi:unnamed protein product [marine sediment metagenome]|uniref:Uncharacterized protein n=1 Tax=marine sediment metagenome TaxID=412755 RepID=X1RXH9_9ZZZZ